LQLPIGVRDDQHAKPSWTVDDNEALAWLGRADAWDRLADIPEDWFLETIAATVHRFRVDYIAKYGAPATPEALARNFDEDDWPTPVEPLDALIDALQERYMRTRFRDAFKNARAHRAAGDHVAEQAATSANHPLGDRSGGIAHRRYRRDLQHHPGGA
jgi:hypothetical protein